MTQQQETTVNAQVGELVHQHMWRNKVTQTALAGVLGIGQPAVARKLRGERPFTIDELLAVAAHLNLPITELVPNAENPRPEGPGGGESAPSRARTDDLRIISPVVVAFPMPTSRPERVAA